MNPNGFRTAADSFEPLEPRTLMATDLPALADAYVLDGGSAGTNFGSSVDLVAKRSANVGYTRETYLRFSIAGTSIAAGQTVKLRLFGRLADTTNNNLPVALLPVANTTWGESTITWNTKPAPSSTTPLDSETISGTTGQWYEWDVTNYVLDEKTNGQTDVSFVLRSTNISTTPIVFTSEEGAANDPVLRIDDGTTPEPPTGTTVTLTSNTSAYVRDGTYANQNFGGATEILAKRSANVGNTREGYVTFDLSSITGNVTAAKVRLNGKLSASGSVAVAVHGVGGTAINESALTWNNKPAAGAALATKTVSGTAAAWHEWDVTTYLAQLKAAGATSVTFALKAPNIADPWAIFASDENGTTTNRPQLVVTHESASEPVQGLVLSKTSLIANEGATGSFTVRLNAQPTSDVTVTIARQSGDSDLTNAPSSLVFTTANWNVAQNVTIAAAQDADTTNGEATFAVSAAGFNTRTITATEADDDVAQPPPSDTTTIAIGDASYVRGGTYANTNFGTTTDLLVKRSATASNIRETYLKFDLSTVSNITSAKLRLYGSLSGSGSVLLNVYASPTSWVEGTITYNNRPTTGTTVLASKTLTSTTKAWHEFDLTNFLKAEKAAGRNTVSVAIKGPNITDPWAVFNADGAASNKPELLVSGSVSGRPVTVGMNLGDTVQTIDGLGSAMIAWIPRDPNIPPRAEYEDPAFYDKIIGDLGATMARIPIWPTFEAVNDNDDPNVFNWTGFDDGAIARTLTFLQRLKDRGVTKFMATVWTPPAWMKTSGSVFDGGMLRPDQREEFAEYIAAFAIRARDQFGIEMTGISLQNEPLFVTSYESMIVTPEQFRELIRTVRRKLDREGLQTVKILMPEDVNSSDRYDWYVSPTLNDAETRDAVGALIAHGTQTDHWNAMGPLIDGYRTQYNKPFWLTEASGHAANWAGALTMGTHMYDALVRGDASAYVYWQWTDHPGADEFALMVDGQPTAKYHVAKHFYRYIRPGAVRINATSSDGGLKVASFKHPTSGAITHVLINTATTAADVTLNLTGTGAASGYKQYRTSATENHVRFADVVGGTSTRVVLPPSSIVTLYSGPDLTTPASTSGGVLPGVQRVDQGPFAVYDASLSSALRTAVMKGQLSTVQTLIGQGADVNAASDAGWTPLHVAAASPYANAPAIINALVDAGAVMNRVTDEGWTPLHAAAANGTTANGTSSTLARDKVNALLAPGASALINTRDDDGRTALHWAGYVTKLNLSGRTEDATVVTALLTGGANKSLLDNFGKTARDYALSEGNGAAATALA